MAAGGLAGGGGGSRGGEADFTGELGEDGEEVLAVQERGKGGVVVGEVLGAHELALAESVDLFVWHPLAWVGGEGLHLAGPGTQSGWVDEGWVVGMAEDKVPILRVLGKLGLGQSSGHGGRGSVCLVRTDLIEPRWSRAGPHCRLYSHIAGDCRLSPRPLMLQHLQRSSQMIGRGVSAL